MPATTAEPVVKLADVMTFPVVTVSPDATPWEAWQVMLGHGVRHVVISAGGRCAGVVDDRTVLTLWATGQTAIRTLRVAQLLRNRTRCLLPGADLDDVVRVMANEHVDAVPVVDDDGWLIGLVTVEDVIAALARSTRTRGVEPDAGCDA